MKNEINIAEEFATMIATKVVDILEERGLVVPTPSQPKEEQSKYPTVYSVDEVCQMLKLSKATLYRHRREGYLNPSYYVGCSPRFTEEDIKKYLDKFNY